jgi:hypothetical protein
MQEARIKEMLVRYLTLMKESSVQNQNLTNANRLRKPAAVVPFRIKTI